MGAVAGEKVARVGEVYKPANPVAGRGDVEVATEITDDVAKPVQDRAIGRRHRQVTRRHHGADSSEIGSLDASNVELHRRSHSPDRVEFLALDGRLPGRACPCCTPPVGEQYQTGDRLVVEIDKMAYGPYAIARHAGFVLFVRGGVPGERVEVQIGERRRHHAFADVIRIERRSSRRRQPACPIVDHCGGCPWQHLSYESQLEAKRAVVADQLSRIGGLDLEVPPVVPSPRVYGYRRRVRLRVQDGRLGFYAAGTHDLVEVAHCALAESAIDSVIAAAGRLVRRLASNVRRLEIVARHRDPEGAVAVGEVEGNWVPTDADLCMSWLEETPDCVGLALRGRGWEYRWGETTVALDPQPDLLLDTDATGFSQVNAGANDRLVETVLELIGEVSGKAVLEAYAGAGNFSAPLAKRGARVRAVEQSLASCRSAERNSAACGHPWVVERGSVGRALARLADRDANFDAILLDPPRNGAAEAIPPILRLAPPRLVYVSCDPATLARDLKSLSRAYRVGEVRALDMFPHTYHVETVARCDRL